MTWLLDAPAWAVIVLTACLLASTVCGANAIAAWWMGRDERAAERHRQEVRARLYRVEVERHAPRNWRR